MQDKRFVVYGTDKTLKYAFICQRKKLAYTQYRRVPIRDVPVFGGTTESVAKPRHSISTLIAKPRHSVSTVKFITKPGIPERLKHSLRIHHETFAFCKHSLSVFVTVWTGIS
jgi:hypothetical protein